MPEALIVLPDAGSTGQSGTPGPQLIRGSEATDLAAIFRQYSKARWIVRDAETVFRRLRSLKQSATGHRLFALHELSPARRELASSRFRVVISPGGGARFLPEDELLEAVSDAHADERIIGGLYDEEDRQFVFYRGNFDRLVVPLSWFRATARGPKPDPSRLNVSEWGHTVQLGDYEATSDAIFYDFDPEVRARMKAREVAQDRSFGGSLRRLRLLRGLTRADFEPAVSEKTIARIETGEVTSPQHDTLMAIAKRLDVQAHEIGTY